MKKVSPSKNFGRTGSPPLLKVAGTIAHRQSNSLTPLNFKVSVEFHREFKTYAAQRGISMLELLQEGFRLTKEHRGD
jgi:hypothetical protein